MTDKVHYLRKITMKNTKKNETGLPQVTLSGKTAGPDKLGASFFEEIVFQDLELELDKLVLDPEEFDKLLKELTNWDMFWDNDNFLQVPRIYPPLKKTRRGRYHQQHSR